MSGILAILAVVGFASAGSLIDAEARLRVAPLDSGARLAFAEALASTPGRQEEGVEALWWLLRDPEEGPIAREVLGEIVRAEPVRPGWAKLYATLATGAPSPGRDAARVRLAELRARDAKARARAIAQLASYDDPLAAVALGDLWVEAGDVARAEAAWRKAAKSGSGSVATSRLAIVAKLADDPVSGARALVDAGFREGAERVLAALLEEKVVKGAPPAKTPGSGPSGVGAEPLRPPAASGRTDAGGAGPDKPPAGATGAPASPSGPLAQPGAGASSADAGTPRTQPEATASSADAPSWLAGAPAATGRGNPEAPDAPIPLARRTRLEAALLLSELRLARGDGEGAARAAEKGLAIAADDNSDSPAQNEARAALVRALLATGKVDQAQGVLAAGVPARDRSALELTLVLTRARFTPSLEDDLPAAAAAFAGAPDEVDTAGMYGRLLVNAKRDADAVGPLQHAAMLRPDDPTLQGLLVSTAVKAGQPGRALDAAAAGLARAPSPEARTAELDAMAGLLLAAADAQRKAGANASARTTGLVALAIRPESPGVARAVGGAFWGDKQLGAAYALYTHAAALDPKDPDAGRAAAALAAALGRREEAEERLARLPKDDPGVIELRDELARQDAVEAAQAISDPGIAERSWRALIERWPKDARMVHGLADAYARNGRLEEALALQKAAVELAPDDPWNHIGVIQVLLAMGREDEAAEILGKLPVGLDDAARRERDRIRARLLRRGGDTAREAQDPKAAIVRYRESLTLEEDVWTSIALAGALVATGEHVEALNHFRNALSSHGGDATIDTVASRGEAGALEAMGQGDAALAVLEALAARRPDPETDRLREELSARLAVLRADALRRAGDLAGARAALAELAIEGGNQPLVQAAWAAYQLDAGNPSEAIDAAARALTREPTNPWALDVARRAGRACSCSARVVPLYEAAVAGGGGEAVATVLRRVRVAAASETAVILRRQKKRLPAADAMREATTLARGDAPSLVLLSEDLRAYGKPAWARAALRDAWRLDPDNAEVFLAVALDLEGRGKRRAAIRILEERWAAGRDPRVGEMLARLRRQEPEPRVAKLGQANKEAADARAARQKARALAELNLLEIDPDDPEAALLEAELLGEDDGPGDIGGDEDEDESAEDLLGHEAPTFGPRDLSAHGGRATTEQPTERPKALTTAGFGVLRRSGIAGFGQELATYVPLHVGPPPTGPLQTDVEAVLVRVEDGVSEKWGVAPSIGATTPLDRPFAAWLRAGTSPLGFSDTPYPVWFVGGRGRLGGALAFGAETGRAPLLDSFASWSGGTDIFSGEPFGQVHHTWFGGWAGVGAPWGTDAGLLARLGQSEGIGLEPVGRAEAVAWVGQRIGTPTRNVRIGGEAVGFSHERQADGFVVGQGAFYSPPLFGVATGRLDVRWTAFQERFSVCGGVGAGMQYAAGAPSPWYAPGETFTHNGRFRVAWRTPSDWGVMLEGSWLKAGAWHQETALIRFGHTLDASPPLTTFAHPSAMLWYQGEPC